MEWSLFFHLQVNWNCEKEVQNSLFQPAPEKVSDPALLIHHTVITGDCKKKDPMTRHSKNLYLKTIKKI